MQRKNAILLLICKQFDIQFHHHLLHRGFQIVGEKFLISMWKPRRHPLFSLVWHTVDIQVWGPGGAGHNVTQGMSVSHRAGPSTQQGISPACASMATSKDQPPPAWCYQPTRPRATAAQTRVEYHSQKTSQEVLPGNQQHQEFLFWSMNQNLGANYKPTFSSRTSSACWMNIPKHSN